MLTYILCGGAKFFTAIELWECVLLKIVNRVQKLRKKIGLEPTDQVEIFYETLPSADASSPLALQRVFKTQVLNTER